MKRISLKTQQSSYEVLIGAALEEQLPRFSKVNSGIIIAERIAGNKVPQLGLPIHWVDGGEQIKSLSQIEKLYSVFLQNELDKSSVVIAIGGGALTDAVAFAAATFHRGMPCITVPTTLLSQVDASIGGKNGVNFLGVKNIIGTIVQPQLVLCDLSFLDSLPRAEISNGVAEIIKAALIQDPELFEILKTSKDGIFGLNPEVLELVISRAVEVKADIVGRDEKENHERMKLNLGHTIGHAIEAAYGLSHGQAVACGMVLEAKLAVQLGLCSTDLVSEIEKICELYELPISIEFAPKELVSKMLQDKKRRSEDLKFALPHGIGNVEIISIKLNELEKYISNLCSA